jgi:hypothetical protein
MVRDFAADVLPLGGSVGGCGSYELAARPADLSAFPVLYRIVSAGEKCTH